MRGPFCFMTVNAESIPGTSGACPFAHVSQALLETEAHVLDVNRHARSHDARVITTTGGSSSRSTHQFGRRHRLPTDEVSGALDRHDTLHNISIDEDGVIGDDPQARYSTVAMHIPSPSEIGSSAITLSFSVRRMVFRDEGYAFRLARS